MSDAYGSRPESDPYFNPASKPSKAGASEEFNPYAAPESDIPGRSKFDVVEGGLYRYDKILVAHKQAVFPDRCIKCNEPAEGIRFRRKLSWHPGGYYLIVLLNILIYIIVALIVRKTAKVEVGVCRKHLSRRRWAIAIGWAGFLTGFVLMCVGAANSGQEGSPLVALAVVGPLVWLASIIYGIMASQMLVPERIDEHYVWLKKIGEPFLDELPEWGRLR